MAKALSRISFFMIVSLEARLARRVIIRSRSSAGLLAEIVAFRQASYLDTLAEFEEVNDRKTQDMTRADAIDRAYQHLHSGEFLAELDRRVAYRTESQNPERHDALRAYLEEELQPAFSQLDFSTRLVESPTGKGPYLVAEYRESPSAPTVLMYGHGDVVDGMAGEWRDNLDPWRTTTVC